MEKFNNKEDAIALENNESSKEKIETIQNEEKKFFRKVTESARYFFHIALKENFKKALRTIALATVLSVPVGEKVFEDRENKEVVAGVMIDFSGPEQVEGREREARREDREYKEEEEERELYQEFLEEQKYFESVSIIPEQKRLLKEKYENVDIIDIPNIYIHLKNKKQYKKNMDLVVIILLKHMDQNIPVKNWGSLMKR